MTGHAGPPAGESARALLGGAGFALKVFPLPGVVVFPGAPAPFHVFEPRYRAMVAHALESDRILAVATLRDPATASMARAPVEPVAGAGLIEAHEQLADGRFNILLRGVARVRLADEILGTGRPFREFRIEVLDDLLPDAGPAALARRIATLERIVFELARRRGREDGTGELAEALARMRVPGRAADAVAAALVSDVAARLDILREQDVGRRIDLVVDAVAAQLLGTPGEGAPPAARA